MIFLANLLTSTEKTKPKAGEKVRRGIGSWTLCQCTEWTKPIFNVL